MVDFGMGASSSKPPLQDEYGVVLRCVLSIELVWVEIYGKMRENPPFMGIFGGWYRYHIGFGQLVPVPNFWYRYPIFCFGPVLVFWP